MNLDQLIKSEHRKLYASIIRRCKKRHYGLTEESNDASLTADFIELGFVFILKEKPCPR